MSNKRMPAWGRAMDEARANRIVPPAVREERLQTLTRWPTSAGRSQAAWRGRSGRRYVVSCHPAKSASADPMGPAVVLAIRRSEEGRAEILGVRSFEDGDFEPMRAEMIAAGATELAVHRLEESELGRARIVADLREPA